jgi:hypothetical protein
MINPNTDLGKLLMVLVQEIGAISPLAFKEIDLLKAINQADLAGGDFYVQD